MSLRTPQSSAISAASTVVLWWVSRARDASGSGECGLVHEEIRPVCRLAGTRTWTRVSGEHHGPARSRRSDHLFGTDHPALDLDRFPGVQATEQPALGHPERPGPVDVEPPEAIILDQSVAERTGSVVHGEGAPAVAAHRDVLTRLQLADMHFERHAIHTEPNRGSQDPASSPGSVDGDRLHPALKRHGAQQPHDTQEVIGMEVRQKDVADANPDP